MSVAPWTELDLKGGERKRGKQKEERGKYKVRTEQRDILEMKELG